MVINYFVSSEEQVHGEQQRHQRHDRLLRRLAKDGERHIICSLSLIWAEAKGDLGITLFVVGL